MRLAHSPAGDERPAVIVPGTDHHRIDTSHLTAEVDGAFL